MTSFFKPIKLILEFYYMLNGPPFEIFNLILQIFLRKSGYDLKIACAKFQENRVIIDEKSTKNMRYRITKNNVAQGQSIVSFVVNDKCTKHFSQLGAKRLSIGERGECLHHAHGGREPCIKRPRFVPSGHWWQIHAQCVVIYLM